MRKFFRSLYDEMGDLIRILWMEYCVNWFLLFVWTVLLIIVFVLALTAFLAFRPSAELGVFAGIS